VNPQAVNEVDFDVFTSNKRSILYIRLRSSSPAATGEENGNDNGKVIAFVAIGALLVGAINWTAKAGQSVRRGDELGYFAYGGSTCIAVFPGGTIE
jgi:phosphatidylserine decarboxylase